mmetsp:Transcript_33397/g.117059  ORF Transcript_33397/g.117059 Transcript_33397/m.117059 type:complete len:201 (+) Transcript_33397:292-894(+)
MSRPLPESSTEMVTPVATCATRRTMRPCAVAAAEFLRRCVRMRMRTRSSVCKNPPPSLKSKARSTPALTSGCARSTAARPSSFKSTPVRRTFKDAPCSKRMRSETSDVIPIMCSSSCDASRKASRASPRGTSPCCSRSKSARTTWHGVRTWCSVRETNASKSSADRLSSWTMSSARASLTFRPVSSRMKQRVWLKSPLFV